MTTGQQVSTSPSTLLQRFHEAEGAYFASDGKEFPSLDGVLHPDFVLVEPDSGPYGGEWRGVAGLERFLRAMNDDWSEMGPQEPPELVEDGETVVALATIAAVSRSTGRRVTFPLCQVARFRDGLLVETRVFYGDTAEMNAALGR